MSRVGRPWLPVAVAVTLIAVASGGLPHRSPGSSPPVVRTLHDTGADKDSTHAGAVRFAAPPGGSRDGAAQARALAHAASQRHAGGGLPAWGGTWMSIGPQPIRAVPHYPFGELSGHVSALAYAPFYNTLYLGADGGGVWKSVDDGNSWVPLTDGLPYLTIDSLAVDPNDNRVIYAGTGAGSARYYVDTDGIGIYRSDDGGASWSLYGTDVFAGHTVSAIVVDPTDSRRVYAAIKDLQAQGRQGVAVSTDGGRTWTDPADTPLAGHTVTDLVIDRHGNLFAALGGSSYFTYGDFSANGVYLSRDHGATWTRMSSGLPEGEGDNYSLALDPSTAGNDPAQETLFAAVGEGHGPDVGKLLGVYRTTTGGLFWDSIGDRSSMNDPDGQEWYNLCLMVDPNDPTGNTLYVGQSDVFRTTDARSATPAWQNLSWIYAKDASEPRADQRVMADQHAMLAVGATLFFANDGGVYRLPSGAPMGTVFISANHTLALSQFYGGDVGPNGLTIGGTQDNGELRANALPVWDQLITGDWGSSLIDPGDGREMFAYFYRTVDGGLTWEPKALGIAIDPKLGLGDLSSPLAVDPSNSATLYLGSSQGLWKTTNGGDTWSHATAGLPTGSVLSLAVAPSDGRVLYIGTEATAPNADNVGHIYRSRDAGASWQLLDGAGCTAANASPHFCAASRTCPYYGCVVTSLAVDPAASDIVYAAVDGVHGAAGGHVYRSLDGGDTWQDVSGTLPDVPFLSILVNPVHPNVVYAGSELGVYVTFDGGVRWSLLGTGLPNAEVRRLSMDPSGTQLTAFTWGRSAWRIVVPLVPPPPATPTPTPTNTPMPTATPMPTDTPTPTNTPTVTATPTVTSIPTNAVTSRSRAACVKPHARRRLKGKYLCRQLGR